MWVFKSGVLRKIFVPEGDEVMGSSEDYTTRTFMMCTPHQIHWSTKILPHEEKCLFLNIYGC